uniref:Elongation of very long chain fatty acids protein n=1 Tax=Dermatophagoides pteronyssinus TaxID=6956 RepID=A0A6P6XL56_DERPT|nr:putative fatty acid elongation protein 4 [Dermatophagoides pteronyssinus]
MFSTQSSLFNDIRYHQYYQQFPNGHYNHTINDFRKFPGITNIFEFEKWFARNFPRIMSLSNEYWHYSIYISVIYLIIIQILIRLMKSTTTNYGFQLKHQLIIWNLIMTIFSLIASIRCLPEFIFVLKNYGFIYSYTQNTYGKDIRLCIWYLFFTLSKVPELIDTIFIVLRKRPLRKLHWIHHTLTLIYSWFVFGDVPSTARWMVNMNLIVHTLMYSYYALTSMGYRLPRPVNITLTSMQIIQMLFGFYIHLDCLRRKIFGQPCDVSLAVAITGFSLYTLFFLMFLDFFIRTYLFKNKINKNDQRTKVSNNNNINESFNELSTEKKIS